MERQPISREGFDKLKEELRRLEYEEFPRISQLVADARAEGDLKENAEYHGQREAQGMLQAKINQLKTKLANTYIVEKSEQAADVVSFGSLVTLKDLAYGDEEKYEIVGPGEEDYDSDILKILATSPMAVAMMGKKPGDHFEFEAPRGVQKYEIVAIELP